MCVIESVLQTMVYRRVCWDSQEIGMIMRFEVDRAVLVKFYGSA